MKELRDAFLNRNITQDTIMLARHKTIGKELIIYAGLSIFRLSGWSDNPDKCLDARVYVPVHPDDPCCIMHGLTYKERRRVLDMAVFTQKKLGRSFFSRRKSCSVRQRSMVGGQKSENSKTRSKCRM